MKIKSRVEGFENYASFSVCLTVNNIQPLYEAMRKARPFTAESAEAFARDMLPTGTPEGIKPSQFHEVNWTEIAEDFNAD